MAAAGCEPTADDLGDPRQYLTDVNKKLANFPEMNGLFMRASDEAHGRGFVNKVRADVANARMSFDTNDTESQPAAGKLGPTSSGMREGEAQDVAQLCARVEALEAENEELKRKIHEGHWTSDDERRAPERRRSEQDGQTRRNVSVGFIKRCEAQVASSMLQRIQAEGVVEPESRLFRTLRGMIGETPDSKKSDFGDSCEMSDMMDSPKPDDTQRSWGVLKNGTEPLQAVDHQDKNLEGGVYGHQDSAYMPSLLPHAHDVKIQFDKMGRELAQSLEEIVGTRVMFIDAPIRGSTRSEETVNISGFGNASKLVDCVRGTLMIEAADTNLKSGVYQFLRAAAGFGDSEGVDRKVKDILFEHDARLIRLRDRFANTDDEYRDWWLSFEIEGMSAELQINFDIALHWKENELHTTYEHTAYEIERKLSDSLLFAAMKNDIKAATMAIQQGATPSDKSIKDANGLTPLHYAAFNGHDGMVTKLLELQANPLWGDNADALPLSRAVTRDHEGVVSLLAASMSKMANTLCTLSEASMQDLLLSWCAAERRQKKYASDLCDLVEAAMPSKDDQMHVAARSGDAFAIKHIFKRGGKPNVWRFCPELGLNMWSLDEAIMAGSGAGVRQLLECGGRLIDDGPHLHPQNAAIRYAEQDQAPQLNALLYVQDAKVMHGDDNISRCKRWGEGAKGTPITLSTIMEVAISRRSFSCLQVLLDRDCAIDPAVPKVFNDANKTLREAAGSGSKHRVQLLLALRALADAADHSGRSALHYAASNGCVDVMKLLVESGISPDSGGNKERTPLWEAGRAGRLDAVNWLISVNANVNKKDTEKQTSCVQSACEKGHVPIVLAMMEARADPNVGNKAEYGAVHAASTHGLIPILEILRDSGCDMGKKTGVTRATPAHYAADNGQLATLGFLSDCGAPLNERNTKEQTPLMMAARKGFRSCFKFLASKLSVKARHCILDHQMDNIILAYSTGTCDRCSEAIPEGQEIMECTRCTPALGFPTWRCTACIAEECRDDGLAKLALRPGDRVEARAQIKYAEVDIEEFSQGTVVHTKPALGVNWDGHSSLPSAVVSTAEVAKIKAAVGKAADSPKEVA